MQRLNSPERRLAARPRKALVVTHIIASGSWLGVSAVGIVLAVAGASSNGDVRAHFGHLSLELVNAVAFPALPLATLVTGLALSAGTKWKVRRHRWVLLKLVLAVSVILLGVVLVDGWVREAASGRADVDQTLVVAGAVNVLMLGAATALSVFKPRATPRQRRRAGEDGS